MPSRRRRPASWAPASPLILDEVVEGDGLGADEALLEIGMDHRRRLRCGRTGLDRPGAHFLHAGGEIGLQAQQLVAGADHPVQTRLVQAHVGQERRRGRRRRAATALPRSLRTPAPLRHPRPRHARAPRPGADCSRSRPRARWRRTCTGLSVSRNRSRTSAFSSSSRPSARAGLARHSAPRAGLVPAPVCARSRPYRRPWPHARRGSAPFRRFQVGQRQFGVDGLDIGNRIDLAVDVDDVVVLEAAHHMGDGVHLADMGQELVAQALAAWTRRRPGRRCRRTRPRSAAPSAA